jgi:hypothetical protein
MTCLPHLRADAGSTLLRPKIASALPSPAATHPAPPGCPSASREIPFRRPSSGLSARVGQIGGAMPDMLDRPED